MDQEVQHVGDHFIGLDKKRTVETIVHISEDLNEDQRNDLISTLTESAGITDAEFCPSRFHLLLVKYDRGVYSSQDILNEVISNNLHARLIGPI